jgi:GNAT superfamily N-acetyltransferase
MQSEIYFDPDALIPLGAIRMMLAIPMIGRNNILLVAEEDETFLGGVLFHYLKKPNTGFSSFMGTTLAARGKGIARKLHDARLVTLNEIAGKPIEGVFLDSVNPERLSKEELDHERAVGADPIQRWQVFQRLGFRKVNVRYEQPVGGPNGGPVTNMDLLFCSSVVSETIATETVVQTMTAYWTPWLGPLAAKHHAKELKKRAKGERLELVNLISSSDTF